jgi:type IV secretion system protein VirD4
MKEDWERVLRKAIPRGLPGTEDKVPTARWALPDELGEDTKYNRSSLLLGYRAKANGRAEAIGCGDDRHVMLVAGSRAGKGVSYVIPNLLLYEGSAIVIDPKGELARETALRRHKMGQKVIVLDPFGVSGDVTLPFRGQFNPLDEFSRDLESDTAVDDAALLAEALILDTSENDSYWVMAARELVKGLILYALLQEDELRTLNTVRSFFRNKHGARDGLIALQNCGDAFRGIVAGIGHSFHAREDKEFSAIISTAEVQLAFLDSTPLTRCLENSTFKLADLKQEDTKATVYLCLPAGRMGTHAKWLRTVISLTLVMCESVKTKPTVPLLLLLEEFPVLGHMPQIEVAAGQIAGFGVKIWTVLQDLTQLERHYGKSWETFMGNSGVCIFFGNADNTTLEYVSKKLGTIGYDLRRAELLSSSEIAGGAKSFREEFKQHRLLEPHEVELMFARETERALILRPGKSPLVVRRADYRDDPAFEEWRADNRDISGAP